MAKFKGKFLVFQRTARGSRGAPLTFCTIMGLASRLVQSLLFRDHMGKPPFQDARLQVYTDDPWLVAKGARRQIDRLFAIVLLTWELLGFPVATHKATRGHQVKWIGMNIRLAMDAVHVDIPADKVLEIEAICLKFLEGNVISVADLKTFVGKAMSIATIIFTWRPFLSQIYAAMKPDPSSKAPPNCIWTKQVQTPIKWLLAFVHSMKTHLTRTWQIEHFKGQTSDVTICWDSSPFGFGAVLIVDGSIVQYLADTPQPFEMELLDIQLGSCESQQILESLAGLVALREWSTFWMNLRAKLALRSDNVGALVLLSKLKTSSVRNAIVAREFALDLGNACFAPSLAEHIPGFSNVCCDALSRLHDPSKSFDIPRQLLNVPRVCVSPRPCSWWRSLYPPQLGRKAGWA